MSQNGPVLAQKTEAGSHYFGPKGPKIMTPGFVLLLLAGCAPAPAGVAVETMDVAVTVLDDGSARVEERLVVNAGDRPATGTVIRRRSPVWRHDGTADIAATLDGATLAVGDAPGQLRVQPGAALDAQVILTPAPASPSRDRRRVLTLSYRALNVVAISGIRGTVSWLALPAARDFDVAVATVTLTLPATAILLQDPWVEEAGWTVTREPHGLRASRSGIARGESATAGVEFTIDRMNLTEPAWQVDIDRASEFMPAFVSAGLFILVTGVGILAMLRLKFPKSATGALDRERVAAARDLRTTAWIVIVTGLGAWVFVASALDRFGIWPMAVPVSMILVGVLFLAAAARVLYFARVQDGRTSA